MEPKEEKLETLADVEHEMNAWQEDESKMQRLIAVANGKIARVREVVSEEIAEIEARIKEREERIKTWARADRKRGEKARYFPNDSKTLDLQAGTISFRDKPGAITLIRGTKTKEVIEMAKQLKFKSIISTPDPSLDKNEVKKMYEDGDLDEKDLTALGLQIEKGESCNVTLNKVEEYA